MGPDLSCGPMMQTESPASAKLFASRWKIRSSVALWAVVSISTSNCKNPTSLSHGPVQDTHQRVQHHLLLLPRKPGNTKKNLKPSSPPAKRTITSSFNLATIDQHEGGMTSAFRTRARDKFLQESIILGIFLVSSSLVVTTADHRGSVNRSSQS
jgi:hypothetical protein